MAVTINLYDPFKEYVGDGTIDLDNAAAGAFDVRLMGAGHSFNAAHSQWSEVSANEIAAGNGYSAGGQDLGSVTWTRSGGTVTWDAADVTWTASGGSITASHAVIVYDAGTNDELVASIDFGGSESAGDGTDFLITWAAGGIFTLS